MDKGYFRFSNDIAEALIRQGLPGAYMSVVLYVLRKTVGWGKTSDRISITKMANEIGISRRWCGAVVSDLEKMGILETDGVRSGAIRSMTVRHPENWDEPAKYSSQEKHGKPAKYSSHPCEVEFSGNEKYSSQVPAKYSSHTKDNIKTTKDTIEKESSSFSPDSDEEGLEGDALWEACRRWKKENGPV